MTKTKQDFVRAADRWEQAAKNWERKIDNLECRKKRAKTKQQQTALQSKIKLAQEKQASALEYESKNREKANKLSRKKPEEKITIKNKREKLADAILKQQKNLAQILEKDYRKYIKAGQNAVKQEDLKEKEIKAAQSQAEQRKLKRDRWLISQEILRNIDLANVAQEKLSHNPYQSQDDPRNTQLAIKKFENILKADKIENIERFPKDLDLFFKDYQLWITQYNLDYDIKILEKRNQWADSDLNRLSKTDPRREVLIEQKTKRTSSITRKKKELKAILKQRRMIDDQIWQSFKAAQSQV